MMVRQMNNTMDDCLIHCHSMALAETEKHDETGLAYPGYASVIITGTRLAMLYDIKTRFG